MSCHASIQHWTFSLSRAHASRPPPSRSPVVNPLIPVTHLEHVGELIDERVLVTGLKCALDGAKKSTSPAQEREDAASESAPQGTTNPELLRSLDMASTMYLLAALQRFEKLPASKVKQVAFEVAVMGMSGLDYASSEKKYRLNALPGESFSGLELMCLMHAGLRQVQPDADTGMDLDKPFEAAKQLHSAGKGQGG